MSTFKFINKKINSKLKNNLIVLAQEKKLN